MKCNWLRWLWGIIPVAIPSWAAVQAERPRIEQELTEAATAQMLQSGAGWAQVTLQGRDAVLSGKAWEEADTEAAVDALRKQRGIRVVDNKAALVEKAETYVWSASRRNQRIRLSGFVPTAAMRRDILGVAKASFPGFDIVDRMALARGVPAADIWLGGISFGLTQLAGMRRGEVRLDNLTLSIVGEAEDQGALRAIRQAANNPPRGIKINLNQLAAPAISPYTWSAQVADGKFDLAGYSPDETLQAELVAAAKSVARGGAVTDRMQGGSGAPADWSRATQAAVRALARLESGAAELRDATLLVSGVSADEAAAEAVRALLRADLPASIKLTEQIRLREPPEGLRRGAAASARACQAAGQGGRACRNPRQGGDPCQGRDTRQSRGARQGRGAKARGAGQDRSAHQGRNTGAARAEGGGPVRAEGRRAGTTARRNKGRSRSQGLPDHPHGGDQIGPYPV